MVFVLVCTVESVLIPLWNGGCWQLVAVGHAGCSQPANAAIQTAIPGLSAVGDGPQSQAGCAAHAIAAPGLASAARASLSATDSPVT